MQMWGMLSSFVLCSRFPGNVADARQNMARLLGAANQAQTAQIGVALSEIRAMSTVAPTTALTTTSEYKVQNYAQGNFASQVFIKHVEKGEEFQEVIAEMLDPVTGNKYLPSPKTDKVSSVVNLMCFALRRSVCVCAADLAHSVR